MKNRKNIIIILITLLIGGFIGWLVKPSGDTAESSEHDHAAMEEDQIWTCSMHPQIRQQEPGDCPICGMDLIPLSEDNATGDPEVYRMSENALKLANVRTMIVGSGDAQKEVRLNGKVVVDERNAYTQATHIPGRIEQLRVNFTGESVSRGQTLATIYSPELVTAQEELLQAQEIKEGQPELFEAAKQKLRNWKIGENQIQQILNNNQAIQRFPITADVSGIVTEKIADQGDYLEQGMPVYEISNLEEVWVVFDLYESELGWIEEGSTVEYTIRSLPGETFTGEISFIDPLLNSNTRVAMARVEVENENGRLKPGMFASGVVENQVGQESSEEIVVPKSAVLWTGERSLVYIKSELEDGAGFKLREVTLGPSLGDSYVIENGLQVGDEIVVNGTFTVDAAVQLAGKPSMMNPDINQEVLNETFTLPEDARSKAAAVVENYLQLKDALVNDDFDSAKESASSLGRKLANIDPNTFSEEARATMEQFKTQLQNRHKAVAAAGDISAMRSNFDEYSEVMINFASTFQPLDQKLFVQHCPMADNDNGANWLSLSGEIRNPYYGEAMLTCGEVLKEIN
ncbi:efflux RND transporter periplasmic adaptor subunit [Salegentibacter sp. F188]|uniref:Efflux RND transporter periplasmic adaptor subunit n=1 Tax=Autumnicola patrickiae TaxID=3075591 RepID=A0ABU3E0D9_9FLAO|nr:efflux RND transporter periplasmic adaptor subunit [Salegentibacter sp. F188]MDT0689415.1 efflux RND transporter periplasmic adaptor subunit [Salegentibacter sp. F188]